MSVNFLFLWENHSTHYKLSRQTLKFIVNNTKDSFGCRAAMYYNKLTLHIRHARSLEKLKKDVKVFICLLIKF